MTEKYSWTDNPTVSGVAICDTDILNDCLMHLKYENKTKNIPTTNCITEIPQDIKLELNDGVLTLKAGSKVYMPNGVDVFDEIIIENDQHWNYGTGEFLILVNSNGVITGSKIEHIYSGTSSPTIVAGVVWYDTTNNIIKRSQTGTDWEEKNYALPISVVTTSSGSVTSIDQTFNGFGYIGSTIYVLPNVKGLIPNGRNEDGNLRNIEFTTSKVLTTTNPANSNAGFPLFFSISDENLFRLTTTSSFYDKNRNLNYDGDRQAYTSTCFAGTFLRNSSGQVISFNPKQTFNALDYSDYTNGVGSTKAYITETYKNGKSWYRIYSDGWCEQGGHTNSSNQQVTITLLKNYKDTNYSPIAISNTSGSAANYNSSVNNLTTSSFQFNSMVNKACYCFWEAKGYIR